MNLRNVFGNDAKLKAFFSWLTRIGAGRKFGSLPIGWYQMHQCNCYDILKDMIGTNEYRFHGGYAQMLENGKWFNVILPSELFRQADVKTRK